MPKPQKQEGDDPDPTPYLFVSLEQKRIDQTKPYDAKKACWVPDEKEGYLLGEIKATKGDLVTVTLPGGEVRVQIKGNFHLHCLSQSSAEWLLRNDVSYLQSLWANHGDIPLLKFWLLIIIPDFQM